MSNWTIILALLTGLGYNLLVHRDTSWIERKLIWLAAFGLWYMVLEA